MEIIGTEIVAYADLFLIDGGTGDGDHTADGVILEPGGLALPSGPICSEDPALLGGQSYTFIQSAYDAIAIGGNDTIQIQSTASGESLILDRDVIVTLKGGYDCFFNEPAISSSSINFMTISNGTVMVENIVISPPPCDSSNILLCTNIGDCTAAGGYWWSDNSCLGVPESETVVSVDGRIWMGRNLGASRVATSPTDTEAYGDLYQWGRGPDGHQLRTSAITDITSSTDDPGHGDFIKTSSSPFDWRVPQNDSLWQGVYGINNPCPTGFRLPTETEWEAERLSWNSNDAAGAFASPLKLVLTGYRHVLNGTFINVNTMGSYWASTVTEYNDKSTINIYFTSDMALVSYGNRGYGHSVRCIKD